MQYNHSPDAPRRDNLRVWLFLTLAVVLIVCLFLLPVNRYLTRVLATINEFGIWAPVLLAGLYVVTTVLFVPGTLLSLAAGFLFGLWQGILAVMAGSVMGALAAFFVGRYFARTWVETQAERYPRFAAIDRAIQQAGFKIVLLTRLSPVFPFNALNYLLSITKVTTRDYFWGTALGMIPGIILYVYLGTAAKSLTELARGNIEAGLGQKVLFAVGLVATIVVTVYVTRLARQALREYAPKVEE